MEHSQTEKLLEKIKEVPRRPGVYLFKDYRGKIIYIGKAVLLKNRISSYFHKAGSGSPKTDYMITRIHDFEFIVTSNEVEALLLENNLIKKNQPKYNVDLKDDKSYPYIKLTIKDDFPTAFITRKKINDGSIYYGPYVNAGNARHTLQMMRKHLLIRSCTGPLKRIKRPCLMYHIHRCLGPCIDGAVEREAYADIVNDVRLLLEGKNKQLVEELRGKMEIASKDLRFEQAASYRDFVGYLTKMDEEKQFIEKGHFDEDIIGYFIGRAKIVIQIFHIRRGLLIGRKEFVIDSIPGLESDLLLRSIVSRYYFDEFNIPPVIIIPGEIEDEEQMEVILEEKSGDKVEFVQPQRGRRRKLLDLAMENARLSYETIHIRNLDSEALRDLKYRLRLDSLPAVIEGFDISTLQGKETVASMVFFRNGRPEKKSYRKYKIKTVDRIDDYASMREVVSRRYKRLISENKTLPDLVLVDGGVGQLNAAIEALESVGLFDQPVAALAKKEELIYLPGKGGALRLPDNSPALHILQRVRDEAHRFAVTFQRKRRHKKGIASSLEDIPGIGPSNRKKLLRKFGSLEAIKKSSPDELAEVIGEAKGKTVFSHFNRLEKK